MQLESDVNELRTVTGRPTIRGECDISNARQIEEWLAGFDTQPLEVDLSGVTFIDSTALRALLNVRRRNRHMRIVNPSEAACKLFEITGTVDYLVHDKDIFS
jgi:anti-sigma B factor antagonist/stage II sporulation protein AA (anti-sigma F factor antagonist)